MAGLISVFLITGFLGSGKTTFLNRMINRFPKDRSLMILMNEFGEVGIDGTLVEMEDLEVLEISKGSIFCACVKTDFIKGLMEIAKKIRPEVLIMESTGVANPTDLKKDLGLPIFDGIFELKEQFCMVDASNFLNQFGVFASVENQISSSTRFIINKVDLASPGEIDEIKRLIGEYHPNPVYYETNFADVDVSQLVIPAAARQGGAAGAAEMSVEELESYIDGLLSDPGASLTPPDILMSATFLWKEAFLPAIGQFSAKLPGEVLRAKGFVCPGTKTLLYSYVMGRYDLKEWSGPLQESQKNVLVLIFPPHVLPGVENIMAEFGFSKLGDLMPGMS